MGKFRYNSETDRWFFQSSDSTFDFHCGDALEIKVGNRYVFGRLEYDDTWYIIFPDARFTLRKKWIYLARVA
ncbi:DUF5348 domain-containing protein [Alicyclobacillus tolerans]|uniref:DUF5348 domain-containing protein n=1 Tax=Alicyclobacillus tolerans TaxID=90970 RepID=UPI0035561548|nr:DUF5348 domain-containing protein [Alicyclobacillus tolerans]